LAVVATGSKSLADLLPKLLGYWLGWSAPHSLVYFLLVPICQSLSGMVPLLQNMQSGMDDLSFGMETASRELFIDELLKMRG
jgi:hypothetical protein